MTDSLYVLGALAFFALMLGYVRGCERLGRGADIGNARPGERLP